MIGIGVGIDYALLILTRFRAARRRASTRGPRPRGGRHRGRSVLFAGATVVISLLGLFASASPTSTASRWPRSSPCSSSMAAAFTLLPALLGFAGTRMTGCGSRSPAARRGAGRALAARWSRAVQRRPWTAAIAGAARAARARRARRRAAARLPGPRQRPRRARRRAQAYDLVDARVRRRAPRPAGARRRGPTDRAPSASSAAARELAATAASPRSARRCQRRRRRRGDHRDPDDLAAGHADRGRWSSGCATTSAASRAVVRRVGGATATASTRAT